MREDLFQELLQSAREAVEIRKGRRPAARRTVVEVIDAREVRVRLGLSQTTFATRLGVSVHTLRNWEQSRRVPEGPARVLLRIAATNPGALVGGAATVAAPFEFRSAADSMLPLVLAKVQRRREGAFTATGYEADAIAGMVEGGGCGPASLAA